MRWLLGLAALTLGGCFTDAATPSSSCPAGGAGCQCTAGQGCDGNLECREPGVCVVPNCTPGMQSCVCEAGGCDGDLVCNELDACVPQMASSSGPPTSGSTTSQMTSTSDPTATAGGSSGEMVSDSCIMCAASAIDMGSCIDEVGNCQNTGACGAALMQIQMCGEGKTPLACLLGVCSAITNGAVLDALRGVLGCGITHSECSDVCSGVGVPGACKPDVGGSDSGSSGGSTTGPGGDSGVTGAAT